MLCRYCSCKRKKNSSTILVCLLVIQMVVVGGAKCKEVREERNLTTTREKINEETTDGRFRRRISFFVSKNRLTDTHTSNKGKKIETQRQEKKEKE
jgi:hypothetical protein